MPQYCSGLLLDGACSLQQRLNSSRSIRVTAFDAMVTERNPPAKVSRNGQTGQRESAITAAYSPLSMVFRSQEVQNISAAHDVQQQFLLLQYSVRLRTGSSSAPEGAGHGLAASAAAAVHSHPAWRPQSRAGPASQHGVVRCLERREQELEDKLQQDPIGLESYKSRCHLLVMLLTPSPRTSRCALEKYSACVGKCVGQVSALEEPLLFEQLFEK
jgi:hypothetical protein